ncbi:MAG: hypothetical protein AB1521_16140 [Bacteroidota bacterium]
MPADSEPAAVLLTTTHADNKIESVTLTEVIILLPTIQKAM